MGRQPSSQEAARLLSIVGDQARDTKQIGCSGLVMSAQSHLWLRHFLLVTCNIRVPPVPDWPVAAVLVVHILLQADRCVWAW